MNQGCAQPVIEIALAPVSDIFGGLPEESRGLVISTLQDFVSQQIGKEEASNVLRRLIETNKPVDMLDEIIHISDSPIMFNPSNTDRSRTNGRSRTRPWSQYEDQRLLCAILRYGLNDWAKISVFVGNGRTKGQCSQRWLRGLDPKIDKAPWTSEQDRILLELVETYGKKSWSRISEEIGNRSDVQCRYRYQQLKKETPQEQTEEKKGIDNKKCQLHKRKAESAAQVQTAPSQFFYPLIQGMNLISVPIPFAGKTSEIPIILGQPQQFFSLYQPTRMGMPVFMQQMAFGSYRQPQVRNEQLSTNLEISQTANHQMASPKQGFQSVSALPSVPSESYCQKATKIASSASEKDPIDADEVLFDDALQMSTVGGIFQAHPSISWYE